MSTIIEIEKLALDLPDKERATLVANLLDSLPSILSEEDEGIAEALRRDAEANVNPDATISLAQLDSSFRMQPIIPKPTAFESGISGA